MSQFLLTRRELAAGGTVLSLAPAIASAGTGAERLLWQDQR